MTLKQEMRIIKLIQKYLRTFPPISKNGNGKIGDIKRCLLMKRINFATKGDPKMIEEALKLFEQRVGLIR